MTKFEHRVETIKADRAQKLLDDTLGRLGEAGWELVCVEESYATLNLMLFFKRPLATTPA
ncbi:hypothetical protein FP2506_00380 [Fulvimarina pelagi HTCC2506]|uniref:DUF4177 domain-containing protein n=1 Tax=Fulvimarina pelagi HTCC2506 TaxID=314231 RepID=Q0FXQ9_9HYPH|nr:hypothetical protein [Fulvimarina pelagi]EAU39824.1 hypothetical protein FP2506_00380 [Fulvimarina pelagi HTCC2506]